MARRNESVIEDALNASFLGQMLALMGRFGHFDEYDFVVNH